MTAEECYKITPDKNGWRVLPEPDGRRICLGHDVFIADNSSIGNYVSIDNCARISDGAIIGHYAVIGHNVMIGDGAIIGNYTFIGNDTTVGDGAHIYYHVSIGNHSIISSNARIINDSIIGDGVRIGTDAIIGPNQTTEKLNKYFISTYPEKSIFWKWVTKDFMSPGWGRLPGWEKITPIKYAIGSTIEQPDAIISDRQCDIGLHVFRPGIRPEFVGLCSVTKAESLICLEVEVNREDICFGGLPGNSDKLRVKKLKVMGIKMDAIHSTC